MRKVLSRIGTTKGMVYTFHFSSFELESASCAQIRNFCRISASYSGK